MALFRTTQTRGAITLRFYDKLESEGVFIEYHPNKQLFYVGGHYAGHSRIQSKPITLAQFARSLGIKPLALKRALVTERKKRKTQ